MNDRLNAVKTSLSETVNSIKALHDDLVASANAQKASLIEILDSLAVTRSTLYSLHNFCAGAANALIDMSEVAADVSDKIDETIFNFDSIPVGNYETFIDFCAQCGNEIHKDDTYEKVSAGEILCADCAYPEEDEEEVETEDEIESEVDFPNDEEVEVNV